MVASTVSVSSIFIKFIKLALQLLLTFIFKYSPLTVLNQSLAYFVTESS